jgi:hypothetical protein
MLDDAQIETLNLGYRCPTDAGPAWRAACEYGFDMSLVESSLSKSPEQRLEDHQRMLDLVLKLRPELSHEATPG